MTNPRVDVLVAGAGLAGLIAARELTERGHRVVVLEARDRVGGRTWSPSFPGTGTRVDLGAEWVSPRHRELLRELDRYGLRLAEPADAGPALRWRLGGEVLEGDLPLAPADLAAVEAVYDALRREAARFLHDGPEAYEPSPGYDRPFQSLLDEHGVTGAAAEALSSLGYALMGAFPGEYSALALVRESAAFGGDPAVAFSGDVRRIDGGTDTLSRRLAARLDVRVGSVVRRVAATNGAVAVSLADGTTWTADAVVVAVPLNVVADIAFEPGLPDELRTLSLQRHAGRAVKTWLEVDGVEPDAKLFAPPAPVEAYTVAADGGRTLLAAFHLHDDAAAVDRDLAERRLRDVFPDIAVRAVFGHDWNTDPFARGTWVAGRPGQWPLLKAFWQPRGRIAFAGGDIAREWAGWMEGAIRSGREAAAQVRTLVEATQALA